VLYFRCLHNEKAEMNPAADPQRQHYRITFTVLAVSALSYSLLQSMIIPAIPDIQESLHASATSVSWLLTAFLLTASVATPIVGRLGDMYGKERALLVVMIILAIGTFISAIASNVELMIAGRAIQGIAGGVFPLAFAIIRDEFPRDRVAGGMGLISSILGIGGGLGLVLAGPITEHLSYHWLYWFPLIAVVIGAVATHLFVPESPVKSPGRVNWLAAALLSVGLGVVLVAISQTATWGWGSAKTLGLLAVGLLALAAWVTVELRSDEPLIDMKMMRIKGVWTTNLVAFLVGVGMYASFLLIPEFVQEPTSTGYGFGAAVTASGLFLLPATVMQVVVGQLSGRLEHRFGSKVLAIAGALSCALAFVMLMVARSSEWEVYVASVLLGTGIGLALSSLPNLIVASVPQDQTGVATGVNNVTRTVGGALGAQVVVTFLAGDMLNGAPTESAYTLAFGLCVVALIAGVLVALIIPSARRRTGPPAATAPVGTAAPAGAAAAQQA